MDGSDEENRSLMDSDAPQLYTIPAEELAKEQFHVNPIDEGAKSGAWAWYANLLDKNPLLVKAITAFFILGLGDAAAQGVENLRGSSISVFDWIRAIRFGAFGFLGAPWAHYYYFFLDKYFPPTEKPFTPVTAIKLAIDQGLQAPALLAIIISTLALLKGSGISGVKDDMKAHFMSTLIANCMFFVFC